MLSACFAARVVFEMHSHAVPGGVRRFIMKMKLIDWSKMPRSTMTNKGELLSVWHHQLLGDVATTLTKKPDSDFCWNVYPYQLHELRIAPMKEWLYHDGGACPLPEGLVIQVKMYDFEGRKTAPISSDLWAGSIFPTAIGYRIIGVDREGGYTDDPSEVTE
jgi:hypothetical protein